MINDQLENLEGQFQITKGIAIEEIRDIALNDQATAVQFSDPLSDDDYSNLEKYLFSCREDILLRAYEHQQDICDLNFIKKIPSVRKIAIDSIEEATGFENLRLLDKVSSLTLGINNLQSIDFLDVFEDNLTELSLAGVKLRKTNISVISKFKNLRELSLEGQYQGLEAISHLKNLEKLYLRSLRTDNLAFLSGLSKLWFLDLKLGKVADMSVLSDMPSIKLLILSQLRLNDISFVCDMDELQYLMLIAVKKLEKLPSFTSMKKLRRLFLDGLKDLNDLSSVKEAPALEEFIFHSIYSDIDPIIDVLENPVLREVRFKFREENNNAEFMKYVRKYDKGIFKPHPFIFDA